MKYEPLPWDTNFFDLPIGRIAASGDASLGDAVAEAHAAGARCLYLLCPLDDLRLMHEASGFGFRTYDVRVELSCSIAAQAAERVRDALLEEIPALEQLVRDRIRGTRFWADPRFPRPRVTELYVEWLRQSTSNPEHRTLVIEEAAETAGFITCGLDPQAGVGTIELIAVAANHEGRGLGGQLVAAAKSAFAEAGLERGTVVTQGHNVAAQRAYQSQGYRTARLGFWLHRWID